MNQQQQQRMAAVGTDKELSDLLDFSMVSQRGWAGGGGFKDPGGFACARCFGAAEGEETRARKLDVMGFRCAVFVCVHMCGDLFIFKLKRSLCPSSPPFPSNPYCFLAGSAEVGWFFFLFWMGNSGETSRRCVFSASALAAGRPG